MRREIIGTCELYLCDCMDLMKQYPDKYFVLAIVDPPFGDADGSVEWDKRGRLCGTRWKKYTGVQRTGRGWAKKYGDVIKRWDIAPNKEYFQELFRVSQYQFICGGNYFNLPPSRNFVIWKKLTISENFTMAMAEYIWTNIRGNAKIFEYHPQDSNRFHPTQKPVALYKWLLSRYANPGWKILDTHLGSGTHAIACYDMGFSLVATEIDEDYYNAAIEQLRMFAAQGILDFGANNAP